MLPGLVMPLCKHSSSPRQLQTFYLQTQTAVIRQCSSIYSFPGSIIVEQTGRSDRKLIQIGLSPSQRDVKLRWPVDRFLDWKSLPLAQAISLASPSSLLSLLATFGFSHLFRPTFLWSECLSPSFPRHCQPRLPTTSDYSWMLPFASWCMKKKKKGIIL